MTAVVRVPMLDLESLPPAALPDAVLGAVAYGVSAPHAEGSLLAVPLPVLGGARAVHTTWTSTGPFASGQTGPLFWRHNRALLFGAISLDERAYTPKVAGRAPLLEASRAAYHGVFAAMARAGFGHLVRCWNYLPRINAVEDGLERYQQFNVGRQQAFLNAVQSVQAGAPAASALGYGGTDVVVYFLASRVAPQAIENPRQVSAYCYPRQYGPASPTFSRAARLSLPDQETLFVSGTASIVGHDSIHVGDVVAQTGETLRNIARVVEQANLEARSAPFSPDALQLKVFIRHAGDFPAVRDVIQREWGEAATRALYLQADICRAELQVEIEAFGRHVAETGSSRP